MWKINERRFSRSNQDADECHQKTVPYQTLSADHHGTCRLPHAWPWHSRSQAGRRRWFKARGGEGAEQGPGLLLGRWSNRIWRRRRRVEQGPGLHPGWGGSSASTFSSFPLLHSTNSPNQTKLQGATRFIQLQKMQYKLKKIVNFFSGLTGELLSSPRKLVLLLLFSFEADTLEVKTWFAISFEMSQK